ncbi:MAG: dephospho-CoA kinase [Vicinamibacterales bacterium]
MIRVALTGGIATGKSHCAARFASKGVPVVDADQLAREVVRPGTPGLAAITQRFGTGVLRADGALDRARLAASVFSDDAGRRDLEAIVHPAVYEAIQGWLRRAEIAGAPLAIADIPLLYETARERDFDRVIVVACAPETQLARLVERDGLSQEEARKRIVAQMPIEAKVTRATYVITTDGSYADTDRQVDQVLDELSVLSA